MNREQKEQVVTELNATLNESQAVILTDFKGLKVEQMRRLRHKVAEAGGDYRVVKNTLLRRALEGTDARIMSDLLKGNNALSTTGQDPVPLAKALVDFAKENDKFIIKAGSMSGKILSFDQVKVMADLPSRDVLLARMLGAMNAVPAGLVRVLAALGQNMVYTLAAIRDQKEREAS